MRLGGWIGKQSWAVIIVSAVVATPVIGTAAIGIEALVRARLDDGMLAAPTRFYARRTVLYPGASFDPDRVEGQLKRLGYSRLPRKGGGRRR